MRPEVCGSDKHEKIEIILDITQMAACRGLRHEVEGEMSMQAPLKR